MATSTLSPKTHSPQASIQSTSSYAHYLKAGLLTGIAAILLNNLWGLVAPSLGGAQLPEVINAVSISISSFITAMVAAGSLLISKKLFKSKGAAIYTVVAIVLALASLGPVFTFKLPDGSPAPEGFALLTGPMHIISGALLAFLIPKLVRKT